jgi:hypothetical protein
MPLCTACKEAANVQAGKYRDVPFDQTPCGKCHWTGTVQHNKGQSHISFEVFISGLTDTAAPRPDTDDTEAALNKDDPPEDDTDPDDAGILPDCPDHAALVAVGESDEDPLYKSVPPEVVEAFRDFFGRWLRMTPCSQRIIATRITEPFLKNTEIAARVEVTTACVSQVLIDAGSRGGPLKVLIMRRHRKKRPARRMLIAC